MRAERPRLLKSGIAALSAQVGLLHAGGGNVAQRIALQNDEVGVISRGDAPEAGEAVLRGGVFGEGAQGVPRADRLLAEHISRRRCAQNGTPRRLQGVGRADGRVLVQRKGDAERERAPRGRDALRPLLPQIFQVLLPPIQNVRGEEGGDDAQPPAFAELVVSQDLPVHEHGTDGAPLPFLHAGEGGEEDRRGAVPVAVGKELCALLCRGAAGGEHLFFCHEGRSVPAARIGRAQKRRPLLRGAVQKELHPADFQVLCARKAHPRGRKIVGRGVRRHVEADGALAQQHLIEGEHGGLQNALLRHRHAVGEVVVLRLTKGAQHVAFFGHGQPLYGSKIGAFLHARGAAFAEQGAGGGIEGARVPRSRLNVQRARVLFKGRAPGQNARVLYGDGRVRGKSAARGKRLGGGDELLRRKEPAAVGLQQGERIGKEMGVGVGEGGQHARAVQAPHLVKGGQGGDEPLSLHAEFRSARKGEDAVAQQSLHHKEYARPRAKQTRGRAFSLRTTKSFAFS